MEFQRVRKIIGKVLEIDPELIDEDADFTDDLGADSLDLFEILLDVEEEFDLELREENLYMIHTVADAVWQIKELMQE